MSGGSWDYVCYKFGDVAERLLAEQNPARRALGKQVDLIAKALHDIEWVDSGDYGRDDDQEAIHAALGANSKELVLAELIGGAEQSINKFLLELQRLTEPIERSGSDR